MQWSELQKRLAEPFPPEAVMFRAGSVSRDKKRAQALPYAEPRVYEDRLNEVLGPDWSCRFIPWGEKRLLCELSIRIEDAAGHERVITRTSTGEFDDKDKIAQGTSAEAQAFKRACSKFGLGRYLYDIPVAWVGYDESSCRLTERPGPGGAALVKTTPKLPERARPQLEPVEPVRLTTQRASLLHKELGKLETVASREHHQLAGEALARPVETFTGLTDEEALAVLNHAKRVDRTRQKSGHINRERRGRETTLRA